MTGRAEKSASEPFAFVTVGHDDAAARQQAMTRAMERAGVNLLGDPPRVLADGAGGLSAVECLITAGDNDPDFLREMLSSAGDVAYDYVVLPTAGRRKRLLISDMDSTIIAQECLDELADFAGLKSEVSAITERAMRGELDFEAALTARVAMLEGLALSALQACYDDRITLTPGARTFVATMAAHGAHCLLVSGGFTFFTTRVAEAAGFHAHRGNTLCDDGAVLTGKVGQPILGRAAKQDALETACQSHGVAVSDALAIGDGANDLAMIEAAGLGIAFDAKPVVAAKADAAIMHTDLRAALYFQGYTAEEFSNG